ncbi:hypothetical protein RB195_015782 [Necator americanus]|uniref:MADF domain-containing protein n=1 Tax=Necator americanus TaxID=51031 RepID=A0ABR1E6F4_NECAM
MILIRLVREQEAIWNPNCPAYSKPDLKCAAWNQVQEQMRRNGFEYTLNFLRKQWNSLLVYWKKNLRYNKKPPEREWPFGRSMNFLATRYGSTYPHCPPNYDVSTRDSMDDIDVYGDIDYLYENSQANRSIDSRDDVSNRLSTELEMESSNEEADARLRLVQGDVTPPPIQGAELRTTKETQHMWKRRHLQRNREDIATRNDEEKDEEEVIAETVVPSEEQRRNNVDKYDQYGAFLASTLLRNSPLSAWSLTVSWRFDDLAAAEHIKTEEVNWIFEFDIRFTSLTVRHIALHVFSDEAF